MSRMEIIKTVFPLPQKVVDTNPNLEQNPNYQ